MIHMARSSKIAVLGGLAVVLCASGISLAALLELPLRQRVRDTLAVLRNIYTDRLSYEDKIRIVQFNVQTTQKQLDIVQGLIVTETKQPEPSMKKLMTYVATEFELLEQMSRFAPGQYLISAGQAKAAMEQARTDLLAKGGAPATEPAPAPATGPTGMKTMDDASVMAAHLESVVSLLGVSSLGQGRMPSTAGPRTAPAPAPITPAPRTTPAPVTPAPTTAPATTSTTSRPAMPAASAAAPALGVTDAAAMEVGEHDYQRGATELKRRIDALQGRMDTFAANPHIDFEKIYRQKIADADKQLAYFEGVLNARVAEYRALFNADPPDSLNYRESFQRLRVTKTTVLLQVD
jgi:hypothetical protein